MPRRAKEGTAKRTQWSWSQQRAHRVLPPVALHLPVLPLEEIHSQMTSELNSNFEGSHTRTNITI